MPSPPPTSAAIKVQLNRPNYDAIKYVRSLITAHDYMVDYSVLLGTAGTYSYAFWTTDKETGVQNPTSGYLYTDDGQRYIFYLNPTDDPQYYSMEFSGDPKPWGSTLADTYEQLAFDRAVGWSRWLRLNRQWPNLFCPSGLNFELPMPEEEGLE